VFNVEWIDYSMNVMIHISFLKSLENNLNDYKWLICCKCNKFLSPNRFSYGFRFQHFRVLTPFNIYIVSQRAICQRNLHMAVVLHESLGGYVGFVWPIFWSSSTHTTRCLIDISTTGVGDYCGGSIHTLINVHRFWGFRRGKKNTHKHFCSYTFGLKVREVLLVP